MSNSYYTGGNSGWGTMVVEDELDDNTKAIEEWEVDEDGIPTRLIKKWEENEEYSSYDTEREE